MMMIAIMMMAMVGALEAQTIKLFNGSFKWEELDQVTKQLRFYTSEDLTVKHVSVTTETGTKLYDREVSPTFLLKNAVSTIQFAVPDIYNNLIDVFWDIYVDYEQNGNTYQLYYRLMHNTLYDCQPHKLSDGIFIPCYTSEPEEEEGGTTTAVSAARVQTVCGTSCRLGNVNMTIKNGKKYIDRPSIR